VAYDSMSWAIFRAVETAASLEASMSATLFSIRPFVKRNLSTFLLAVFFVALASTLTAQIVETGVITGVVRDNSGAIIQKAHVAIHNDSTGLTTKTETDSQGIFVSPPLHPGNYSIEIEAPGFETEVEHVRLEVGQRVSADASLVVSGRANRRGPGRRRIAGNRIFFRRQSPHRRSRPGSAPEWPQLQ